MCSNYIKMGVLLHTRSDSEKSFGIIQRENYLFHVEKSEEFLPHGYIGF